MRRRVTLKVTAVATSFVLTMAAVVLAAGPATASTSPPGPPANLRVTELHIDSFAVAWDLVPGATRYSVSVFTLDHWVRPTITIDATTARFHNALFDVQHRVSVRAYVPGHFYTDASTIIVATPLPEGYVKPTTPANLRLERNAQGEIELFRWDAATGGFGNLTYSLFIESPGFLPTYEADRTSALTSDADDHPVCDGCQYDPSQTIVLWVTANDRRYSSPPSQRLVLTCCPF